MLGLLSTRETVAVETPARFATSRIFGMEPFFIWLRPGGHRPPLQWLSWNFCAKPLSGNHSIVFLACVSMLVLVDSCKRLHQGINRLHEPGQKDVWRRGWLQISTDHV